MVNFQKKISETLVSLLSSKSNKIIAYNSIAMMVLQFSNMVIPLITIPYLMRILGPSNYGTIAFVISFISFFEIVVNYGFSHSATKSVAVSKSKAEISKIFSSVLYSKILLAIISISIALIIVNSTPYLNSYSHLIYFAFGNLVASISINNWIFQGLQKMKYITIVNVLCKSLLTIMIFLMIKETADIEKYLILYTLNFNLIGIIGLFISINKFDIRLVKVRPIDVWSRLKEGWYLFKTAFLAGVLVNSGIFILGIYSKEAVGYLSAAEKIARAVIAICSAVTLAIFPRSNQKFEESFQDGYQFVKKIMGIAIPLVGLICIILAVFSNFIFDLLYDYRYEPYSPLLILLCIWIFFSILNNFLGVQLVVSSGNEKKYSKVFSYASAIALICYLVLGATFLSYGIALGMIIGELALTINLLIVIKKLKSYSE